MTPTTRNQQYHLISLLILSLTILTCSASDAFSQSSLEYLGLQSQVQSGMQSGLAPTTPSKMKNPPKDVRNQDFNTTENGNFLETITTKYSPKQILVMIILFGIIIMYLNKK